MKSWRGTLEHSKGTGSYNWPRSPSGWQGGSLPPDLGLLHVEQSCNSTAHTPLSIEGHIRYKTGCFWNEKDPQQWCWGVHGHAASCLCAYPSSHSMDVALRGIISSKWKRQRSSRPGSSMQITPGLWCSQSYLCLGFWGQWWLSPLPMGKLRHSLLISKARNWLVTFLFQMGLFLWEEEEGIPNLPLK